MRRRSPGSPLSVEQTFEATLYLTLFSAHFALITTGEITLLLQILLVLSLVAMAFFVRPLSRLPSWFWNTLLILLLLASLFTALSPPRDFETFFHGITLLLGGVLTVRYFTRSTAGHDLGLLLLSLLEMCAASIATISLFFLFSLALFSVCMITTLFLFSAREEKNRASPPSVRPPPDQPSAEKLSSLDRGWRSPGSTPLDPRFFGFALASTVLVFILGFLIFFLIPRVGRSLFTWSKGLHPRVSGFSETVEMGSVGRIKSRRSLVMRVKLEEGRSVAGGIYLRGAALDYYDGRRWEDRLGVGRDSYHYIRRDGSVPLGSGPISAEWLRQEIILEPTDSTFIFGIPVIRALEISRRHRAVVETDNNYFRFPLDFPLYDRVAYTVWSEEVLEGEDYCRLHPPAPLGKDSPWLQLPAETESVCQLAEKAVGRERELCRQSRRLLLYLQKNYRYDLETPADQAADPLADFLFVSRRGYCEHFATALVLMLRCRGIPARLAVGYLSEDLNPLDNYYRVRENDAHSWVEMQLGTGEWQTLDPTPPGVRPAAPSFLLAWLGDLYDSLKFRWDRYVVDLSLREQYRMATALRDRSLLTGQKLSQLPQQLFSGLRRAARQPLLIALTAVFAALLLLLGWSRKEGRLFGPARRGQKLTPLLKEYLRLLRALEKAGFCRAPSETPAEFARRLEEENFPLASAFAQTTAQYLALRFGPGGNEAEVIARLQKLRRTLARQKIDRRQKAALN